MICMVDTLTKDLYIKALVNPLRLRLRGIPKRKKTLIQSLLY